MRDISSFHTATAVAVYAISLFLFFYGLISLVNPG